MTPRLNQGYLCKKDTMPRVSFMNIIFYRNAIPRCPLIAFLSRQFHQSPSISSITSIPSIFSPLHHFQVNPQSQQNKQNGSHNNTVVPKDFKSVFLQEGNEEFNGQQGNHESHQVTDK